MSTYSSVTQGSRPARIQNHSRGAFRVSNREDNRKKEELSWKGRTEEVGFEQASERGVGRGRTDVSRKRVPEMWRSKGERSIAHGRSIEVRSIQRIERRRSHCMVVLTF